MYFTGYDTTNGYELWSVSDFGSAAIAQNIAAGANSSYPAKLTRAEGFLYFTADDGAGRKLYRLSNSILENIVESGTNLPIFMDADSEIVPVQRGGLGDWVYFTGTPQGAAEKQLYRVYDGDFNSKAISVRTEPTPTYPMGAVVTHARHLSAFVAPGVGGTYRLLFSCDGAGTQFSDPNATDKRFKPRGYELWATEVGF